MSLTKLPIVYRRQDLSQKTSTNDCHLLGAADQIRELPGTVKNQIDHIVTSCSLSQVQRDSQLVECHLSFLHSQDSSHAVKKFGFEIKNGASPATLATFSRHTCPPMFIGMTADQNDSLVSLSPNLNRFSSRTFSMDARFF